MSAEDDAYQELFYYTIGHPATTFLHQHILDAYAAQVATAETKPIRLTFALIGLYLHVERRFTGRQVQRVHTLLARRRREWPALRLPDHRGSLTAMDVLAAPAGPDRDRAIHDWCAAV
ncbi:MAG: DUF5946 family protein [Gemmatimonadaceae bacterium]